MADNLVFYRGVEGSADGPARIRSAEECPRCHRQAFACGGADSDDAGVDEDPAC